MRIQSFDLFFFFQIILNMVDLANLSHSKGCASYLESVRDFVKRFNKFPRFFLMTGSLAQHCVLIRGLGR